MRRSVHPRSCQKAGLCLLQDDEAELLAELDRIKKERAEEAAKRRKEEDAEKETQLREEVARGNPLLNQAASFQVQYHHCGFSYLLGRRGVQRKCEKASTVKPGSVEHGSEGLCSQAGRFATLAPHTNLHG